jgi:uncharacterized membrane protein
MADSPVDGSRADPAGDSHPTRRARIVILGSAVVAVILVIGLVGAGVYARSSSPTPATGAPVVRVENSQDLTPYIRDARLRRSVEFDRGILRLDPPEQRPAITESRAIQLFRAGSQPNAIATDVVVFLAQATVTLTPTPAQDLPGFRSRTVWVVVYGDGPINCPLMTVSPGAPPAPQTPIALIAADHSGQGLGYTTRGSFCRRPATGPRESALDYILSVPWTAVRGRGKAVTLRALQLPQCSAVFSAGWGSGEPVTVWAIVGMDKTACPDASSTISGPGWPPGPHAPVGIVTGFVTTPQGFTYFDGRTHHLPA